MLRPAPSNVSADLDCVQSLWPPLGLTAASSLAGAGETGPTTMKLPATGLTVDLPTGWVARETVFKVSNAPKGAPGVDLVTRVVPRSPTLFFTLVSFGGHTCAEWSSQVGGADPTSKQLRSPAYLPTGWHPVTTAGPTPGRPNNVTTGFCLDSLTGVLIGSMEYQGSLADADVRAITPVLVSIAKASGVESRAVAPPPVAAPPRPVVAPPLPVVAPPPPVVAPPPAAPTTVSPPPPPPPPVAPPPVGPPPPPIASPDPQYSPPPLQDEEVVARGPSASSPHVEIILLSLQPESRAPEAFIATLGLDGSQIFGGGKIGFALGYGVSVGITTDENVPFDGRFGIGFGLRLGRFRLMPLAGTGMDTMGGGNPSSFKLPSALYWYVEGRIRFSFSSFALEGIAAHQARGSIEGDAATVPVENRFTLQLTKQFGNSVALTLGARITDYRSALGVGGITAVSF